LGTGERCPTPAPILVDGDQGVEVDGSQACDLAQVFGPMLADDDGGASAGQAGDVSNQVAGGSRVQHGQPDLTRQPAAIEVGDEAGQAAGQRALAAARRPGDEHRLPWPDGQGDGCQAMAVLGIAIRGSLDPHDVGHGFPNRLPKSPRLLLLRLRHFEQPAPSWSRGNEAQRSGVEKSRVCGCGRFLDSAALRSE